ncbi:MAG: hypothetical protein H7331_01945, partial [Bacteroidia bacterium]|nr:hypothetical protein [Bacteroidia bacterium]
MKTNYSSKLHNVFCKTRTSVIPSLYCFTKYIVQTSKLQHRAALLLVLFSIWSLSGAEAQAQNNVGIGTTTPNAKAILELNANDKGFLTPRMNTTQMNAIATAATENGLLVYNTDSACYHFYNGTVWKNLCQKGIDTAIINKAIKNYLSNVNFTTVINNMLVDSSVTNYAVINNAIVNNITIDSSVINYTTINNAVINNLTVDSSSINFTTINNAVINNLTVDSSATNYASINNAVIDSSITNMATINNANINVLKVDSSVTNYSNINNAVIDSSVTNYSQVAHLKGGWGSMDSLQIGGKNIMQTMSDSIKSQAWLLKGNAGTNASANFIGTTDNSSLRIRTNNTERMIVDNTTGNVGVGLNNPIAKLQVNTNRANGSVVPIMAYDSIFKTGTSIFGWTPGIGFNYHHSGASPQVIKGDNYAGEINFTPADGKMYFKVWNKAGATNTSFVNTTVKGIPMVIDSNLNVGIGTTTPTKTLDVNGDVQLSGNLFFGNGNVRTQTRLDAGLATSLGAQSGFYDNDGLSVVNYPAGATSWWHLIEARHSSTLNTMAMQIAGSHYDQDLWFRKTNNNPAQPWSKILAVSGTNSSLGWLTNGNS